jgi:hypothetical protein
MKEYQTRQDANPFPRWELASHEGNSLSGTSDLQDKK